MSDIRTQPDLTPAEIVERFRLVEDTADPRWASTPKRLWRGHLNWADPTGGWHVYDKALKADVFDPDQPDRPGWQYIEGWIDGPYRVVWVNFAERATFTYCEGDLSLVVCSDELTFTRELASLVTYYGPMVSV